jgi:hypothetical protein
LSRSHTWCSSDESNCRHRATGNDPN